MKRPEKAIEFLRNTHIIWKDASEKDLMEKALKMAFKEGIELGIDKMNDPKFPLDPNYDGTFYIQNVGKATIQESVELIYKS